ncbi:unnamed protein product [Caenorhabditis sp. 36 PRJEB53466]|nr:unnamed protein product [Caenorhabditis sp. 36 PRJEB53466]
MGAEISTLKAAPPKQEPEKKAQQSQYHDLRNPKYVENDGKSSRSTSSESSLSSEDGDEKREPKSCMDGEKKKKEEISTPSGNILKALQGLSQEEKKKKSEEMLRKVWKRPHPTWRRITAMTNKTSERTDTEGQLSEDVKRELDFDSEKIIYDVPGDHCNLKTPKNRTTRSCPDPWRKHGAHAKLCEIGGSMPENRAKNSKCTAIKKGTVPPAPPKTKPLLTVDDYLKLLNKK